MEIQQKPDYFIFAEDAKTGETIDFPNIKRGWGVTLEQTQGKPPLEWFNSAFNRIDKNTLYLLQQGVPEWSADVLYPIGAIIKFNGNLYKATRQNTNLSPDNSPNDWELFIDDASLTKKGIVKLNSAVNSTVENQAATPKAVKAAYDLANNAFPLTGGTLNGDLTARNITAQNYSRLYRIAVNQNNTISHLITGSTGEATRLRWHATNDTWNFENSTVTINGSAVLKAGDGGLNLNTQKATNNINIDTYDFRVGFYSGNNWTSTKGLPFGSTSTNVWFYLLNQNLAASGSDHKLQIIGLNQSGSSRLAMRYKVNGVFTDWAELITTANISNYLTPNVEYWYVNGSEASPTTITTNQEIVINDPYYGKSVSLIPQAYITGRDGTSRWIDCPFNYENSFSNGIAVNQIEGSLYVVGANNYIFYAAKKHMGLPTSILPSNYLTSAKFRIKIIK